MKAMIVPGNGDASMSEIWYPYVKRGLEKLGLDVIAERMPDPVLARKEYWLPFIKEHIDSDENAILIGHSSGVVAILRYLEDNKALGAVLVGAYHTDLGMESEKASGYFDEPWQWDAIKGNVGWIVQFASVNDPFVPIAEARLVSQKTNAEYHEFSKRGHFMETEFPEMIEAIRKKLKK